MQLLDMTDRMVKSIVFLDGSVLAAYSKEADEIKIYAEVGSMAYMPWVEIWKNGEIIAKYNAHALLGIHFEEGLPFYNSEREDPIYRAISGSFVEE